MPHDRENQWSERAQGLAHDNAYWYIAQEQHLYKYFVGVSLASDSSAASASLPDGCGHFGDPDFDPKTWQLYVPLEQCPDGNRIYVYDSNLRIVRWEHLPQGGAPWVSVNQETGLVYSSPFTSDAIYGYRMSGVYGGTMVGVETMFLDQRYRRSRAASSRRRTPATSTSSTTPRATWRGGAQPGIYAFRWSGKDSIGVRTSEMMRFMHPNGFAAGEEMEGITPVGSRPGVVEERRRDRPDPLDLIDSEEPWAQDDAYGKHIRVSEPARL
jgi:hypothetical protein